MEWYERVAQVRKELGLALRPFAERIGFSQSAIKKWESGQQESLKAAIFDLLDDVYGRPLGKPKGWFQHGDIGPKTEEEFSTNALRLIHEVKEADREGRLTEPVIIMASTALTMCSSKNSRDKQVGEKFSFSSTIKDGETKDFFEGQSNNEPHKQRVRKHVGGKGR